MDDPRAVIGLCLFIVGLGDDSVPCIPRLASALLHNSSSTHRHTATESMKRCHKRSCPAKITPVRAPKDTEELTTPRCAMEAIDPELWRLDPRDSQQGLEHVSKSEMLEVRLRAAYKYEKEKEEKEGDGGFK